MHRQRSRHGYGRHEMRGGRGYGRGRHRVRRGDVRSAILALLDDRPMHGYEMITELEERTGGRWRPSAGSIYPTLQLLEDEGYIKADDSDGKKVYHVTPEGERYLEENRGLLDDILDRVRETVRDFTGGGIGELQGAFVHLAGVTFKRAWRRGPEDPALKRVAEILRKAADEIEQAWTAGQPGGGTSQAGGQAS